MTSTITEPETPPDQDLPAMASAPGWGRPRRFLPGPNNPDPAPLESESTRAMGADGAGSGSSEQTASIRALFKGRAKSYAKIAETLFNAVGGILNGSAASAVGDTDAWLPDTDDLETVPPPLGRIAARRIKVGVNPDQLSDLEDIGMVAVGLLMWAAKGLTAIAEARRLKRRLEDGRAVYEDTGDGI